MHCPECNKLMKQTYVDRMSLLNPMTCEEILECACGVSYEFAYGSERFLDKEGREIKIN